MTSTYEEAKESALEWLSEKIGLDGSTANQFKRAKSPDVADLEFISRNDVLVGAVQTTFKNGKSAVVAGLIENNLYVETRVYWFAPEATTARN